MSKKSMAEIEALEKFKAYVHKRLDDAGVPADPESPHKAEGCRIGGRLDIVLAAFAAAPDLRHETKGAAMSEKFTEGPWSIERDENGKMAAGAADGLNLVVGTEDRTIAFCFDDDSANAALVIAAPDLYAANKDWVDYFDELNRLSEPGDRLAMVRKEFHSKRVAASRAALAKAAPADETK